MISKTDADIWTRIIQFSWTDLSPQEAKGILRLKFKRTDAARAHKLGELSQERRLTKSEQEELEQYVHVGRVLSILHSFARRSLKSPKEVPARRKAS